MCVFVCGVCVCVCVECVYVCVFMFVCMCVVCVFVCVCVVCVFVCVYGVCVCVELGHHIKQSERGRNRSLRKSDLDRRLNSFLAGVREK